MRFSPLRFAAWLLPLILASAAEVFSQSPPPRIPPKPTGSMLLLHYRWQHDSLALIVSKRIPAAVKTSRLSPEKRASGRDATGRERDSAFSFELAGADGKRISTRYLQDPGLRRVEYQEKGRRGLKSQVERVDSSDIFLRIPEADAKTIRFFRHAQLHIQPHIQPHMQPHIQPHVQLHAHPLAETTSPSDTDAKPAMATAKTGLNGAATAQTPEFIVVRESGPRDKRVNIVILGDGYTASEKPKFLAHLKTVADVVVQDMPLTEYADYFNIYGIFVASNQSGADVPSQGIFRDTYFDASYSGRLLTVNGSKAFTVINGFVPEAEMEFVVVNDETYGGSGGPVAVASFAAPEIIAHEAQHSFSGLGDEYDYPGVSPWEAPNTTKQTNRADIRWSHWIAATTPVPTPETPTWSMVPGLFEGAAYNATDWYRPKQNCRMRENGIPFCEPCSETIILSMYEKVSPLDSAFPKPGGVSVFANEIPPLRVKAKKPLGHDLVISWIVNGNPLVSAKGDRFDRTLAPGIHKVVARVADTTHLVRKDIDLLLVDSVAWQVTVSSTTRIASLGEGIKATLLAVDADEAWINTGLNGKDDGRNGRIRIVLRTADGKLADRLHAAADASGLARAVWSRPLLPGAYFLEIGMDGRTVRSRFRIAP